MIPNLDSKSVPINLKGLWCDVPQSEALSLSNKQSKFQSNRYQNKVGSRTPHVVEISTEMWPLCHSVIHIFYM